jgi:hypothetical protein
VSFLEILQVIGLILWIVLSLGLLTAMLMIVPSIRRLDRASMKLNSSLGELRIRAEPIFSQFERAADSASYITSAVASDAERVSQSLERATDSLTAIVELAEERAIEISGFLEVVQEEAEETFFSTASLLRGLRAGRLLTRRRERRSKARKRRTG